MKNCLYLLFILLAIASCKSDTTTQNAQNEPQNTPEKTEESPRIKLLSERIAQDTTNAELYFARANAFLEDQNAAAAAADILLAMKNDSSQAKYYLTASDILIQTGNGIAAVKILQNGLGQLPTNTTLWLERAKLHYYLRQYDEAEIAFKQLLSLEPTNPQAYFFRGLMNKERQQTELAIKDFETAVEHNPDFYDAILQLGLLFSETKPEIALAYFDNALRLDPQSSEAWYAKGFIFQNNQKINDAKDCYKKIISFDQQNANALYNLGFLYFSEDSLDLAFKHFNITSLVEPTYYRAYYMKGKYWEKIKDFAKAKTEYQNALNINPEHEQSKKGLQRVSQ